MDSTYKYNVQEVREMLGISMSMINKYLRMINTNRTQFPNFKTVTTFGRTLYYSDNEVSIIKDLMNNRDEFVLQKSEAKKVKQLKPFVDKTDYIKYSEIITTVENYDKLPKSQVYNHLMQFNNLFTKIGTQMYVHKDKLARLLSLTNYYILENYDDDSVHIYTLYDIKKIAQDEYQVAYKELPESDEVFSTMTEQQLKNKLTNL